jgi:GTP diphosphokinase / guanosine-3',5'-bis(diphosphate) 3'-diphosphatase
VLINGRQMPLTTNLRNGDEVVVLTAKGHVPPAAWETIAVTGRARAAIRRASRDALRRQYSELGRRLVESASERLGLAYADERLKKSLPRLAQRSVEDVHVAVGRNELPPNDVLRAMFPEATISEPVAGPRPVNRHVRAPAEDGWFNLSRVMSLKFRWPGSGAAEPAPLANGTDGLNGSGTAIPIRGLKNDMPISWEQGGAVPGDRIVGVLTGSDGVRIYQIHSPRLADVEHERWIDVTWDINPERPERFPAKIKVTVLNKPGTLAQVAQVIGEADGNIDALRMTNRAVDFTDMAIDLEVWDLTHLNEIISGLKSKPAVSKAERVFE